jgi:hypothetical protein
MKENGQVRLQLFPSVTIALKVAVFFQWELPTAMIVAVTGIAMMIPIIVPVGLILLESDNQALLAVERRVAERKMDKPTMN